MKRHEKPQGRDIAGSLVNNAPATIPEVQGTRKLILRVVQISASSGKLLTRPGFTVETSMKDLITT